MDFAFTSDQQLLKNSARAFLDEHCKPALVRALMDDPRGESEAMWKEMAQLGWLGLALPESVGGAGLGMVETAILLEELGRAACPTPYWPTLLAALAIEDAGTAEQQNRWLPSMASGGARGSVAFMEGELDWDPASITTRAETKAAGATLSGVKQFVPWATVADVLVVPARSTQDLALYLVDPRGKGVTITPLTGMDLGTRWATVQLEGAEGAPLSRSADAGAVYGTLFRRAAVGAVVARIAHEHVEERAAANLPQIGEANGKRDGEDRECPAVKSLPGALHERWRESSIWRLNIPDRYGSFEP